jgi:hypothetical protein
MVPTVFAAFLWLGAREIAGLRPDLLNDNRSGSVEWQVIKEQMNRLFHSPPADVAILGDSSALVGIDPQILEQRLGKSVESFATIGVLGPAGYALMLDMLREQHNPNQRVVLVTHPIQFHRIAEWEVWVPQTRKWAQPAVVDRSSAPIDLIRGITSQKLVYSPLPGSWGLYFGSPENLVHQIHESKGSAIDPASGLNFHHLRDLEVSANLGAPGMNPDSVSITPLYLNALKRLRKSVKKFGSSRVYLVLGPAPIGPHDEQKEFILGSFNEVAEKLGIVPENVLVPKNTFDLDYKYFSTTTHLNRFGKILYSRRLADDLRALRGESP